MNRGLRDESKGFSDILDNVKFGTLGIYINWCATAFLYAFERRSTQIEKSK